MNTNLKIEDVKVLIDILDILMDYPHCVWVREQCVCSFCNKGHYSGYYYIDHTKDCPTYKFGDLHNKLYEDIWEHENQNA